MRDMFNDPGWGTMRVLLGQRPKVAAFVGGLDLSDGGEQLPDRAFADENARRFPIHEKRAAALSFLYAQKQNVPLTVMRTIKEALAAYELDEAMFAPETEKVAEAAPDECLFPETRAWPVRNAEEVKLAETALHAERSKLLPEERAQAYGRLHKFAQAYGATLDDLSHRYNGFVQTDPSRLRDELNARAVIVEKRGTAQDETRAKIASAFRMMADSIAERPRDLNKREVQAKLAAAISDLDTTAGVQGAYDKGLPDPLLTVFNTTKHAGASDLEIAGTRVSVRKLASLPSSFYADALGEDFARELAPGGQVSSTKLAEILPTLPLDMQRVLAIALRSTGR